MKTYSNNSVLLVGVARNCTETIASDINRLLLASSRFNTVHFLLIESDSSDTSLVELQLLKEKIPNFNYITLGSLSNQIFLRTERIAYCRNVYLKELKTTNS